MAEQTNREWKEHFLDTQHSHAYVSISNLYTVSMHHSKVLTFFTQNSPPINYKISQNKLMFL